MQVVFSVSGERFFLRYSANKQNARFAFSRSTSKLNFLSLITEHQQQQTHKHNQNHSLDTFMCTITHFPNLILLHNIYDRRHSFQFNRAALPLTLSYTQRKYLLAKWMIKTADRSHTLHFHILNISILHKYGSVHGLETSCRECSLTFWTEEKEKKWKQCSHMNTQ